MTQNVSVFALQHKHKLYCIVHANVDSLSYNYKLIFGTIAYPFVVSMILLYVVFHVVYAYLKAHNRDSSCCTFHSVGVIEGVLTISQSECLFAFVLEVNELVC